MWRVFHFFTESSLVPIPDEFNDIFDCDNHPVYMSDWTSTSAPSEHELQSLKK
jgi:hypothetical protein